MESWHSRPEASGPVWRIPPFAWSQHPETLDPEMTGPSQLSPASEDANSRESLPQAPRQVNGEGPRP